jgi:hypothetical protein
MRVKSVYDVEQQDGVVCFSLSNVINVTVNANLLQENFLARSLSHLAGSKRKVAKQHDTNNVRRKRIPSSMQDHFLALWLVAGAARLKHAKLVTRTHRNPGMGTVHGEHGQRPAGASVAMPDLLDLLGQNCCISKHLPPLLFAKLHWTQWGRNARRHGLLPDTKQLDAHLMPDSGLSAK